MCACEPSFVCSQCKGTPFDPDYDHDAEPMSPQEFDVLVDRYVEPWEGVWA